MIGLNLKSLEKWVIVPVPLNHWLINAASMHCSVIVLEGKCRECECGWHWCRVMCPGLLCDSMPGLSDPRPPHNSPHFSPLLKAHTPSANEGRAPSPRVQSESRDPVWSPHTALSPKICRVDNNRPVITSSRDSQNAPLPGGPEPHVKMNEARWSILHLRLQSLQCLDISIRVLISGTCWVSSAGTQTQSLRWTNTD